MTRLWLHVCIRSHTCARIHTQCEVTVLFSRDCPVLSWDCPFGQSAWNMTLSKYRQHSLHLRETKPRGWLGSSRSSRRRAIIQKRSDFYQLISKLKFLSQRKVWRRLWCLLKFVFYTTDIFLFWKQPEFVCNLEIRIMDVLFGAGLPLYKEETGISTVRWQF